MSDPVLNGDLPVSKLRLENCVGVGIIHNSVFVDSKVMASDV